MHVEHAHFNTRTSRTEYLATRFKEFLTGKTLDVGCNEAPLRSLMPALDYTGIDVSGSPDIELNLERIERLPFDDNEFDTTICIDVLEHLDNLHFIFNEIIRVTRGHAIISLPNCWSGVRKPLNRGLGAVGHYGLPGERPIDRHKWFFNLSEAKNFFESQTQRLPIGLEQTEATERPRFWLKRAIRHLVYPSQERYLNRYAHTLWAVFKKT